MKTAVIFTGGTILSARSGDTISICEPIKSELLALIGNDFDITVFSPYIIHSEQLDGEYLTMLIDEVDKVLSQNFEAVLIFHGTDTLQYSAAALSLAFGDSKIPIVLVSANYVLSDERSNGRANLRCALSFIKEKIGGVFVSYQNTGEAPEIHLGNLVLPHSPYSDRLDSFFSPYGYFDDGRFVNLICETSQTGMGKFHLQKQSPVLFLKAFPGMVPPSTDGYKAVLIEAYHSGTLPTESPDFIAFCKNSSVPIFAVGVSEGARYESALAFESLNIRPMPPISPVFAYIILWQKYS